MNKASAVEQAVARAHILLDKDANPNLTTEARAFRRFLEENPGQERLTAGYLRAAQARYAVLKDVSADEIRRVINAERLNLAGLNLASKIYGADLTFDMVGYHAEDIDLNWDDAKKSL